MRSVHTFIKLFSLRCSILIGCSILIAWSLFIAVTLNDNTPDGIEIHLKNK